MKIIDILRKLGILRVGYIAGTYISAKDMPDGLVGGQDYDSWKKKSRDKAEADDVTT